MDNKKEKQNLPLAKKLHRLLLMVGTMPLVIVSVIATVVIFIIVMQTRTSIYGIFEQMSVLMYDSSSQSHAFAARQDLYLMDEYAKDIGINSNEDLATVIGMYKDKMGYIKTPFEYAYVMASSGEIVHFYTEDGTMAADEFELHLTSILIEEVIPQFSYIEEEMHTVEDMLTHIESNSSYSDYGQDPSYVYNWLNIDNDVFLGTLSFNESSKGYVAIIYGFVSDMWGEAENSINEILIVAAAILVFIFALLLYIISKRSKELSMQVSLPIDQRERDQEEALMRTEQEKEMLEQLNDMKTQFLSNVSHELKTPLTVVSAHMQLGKKNILDGAETKDLERTIDLVNSEVERMVLMVKQLLDIGKIDEGRMEVVPTNQSVTEIIQETMDIYYPVFSKNNNSLEFIPNYDMPVALCDKSRVIQVLVNLITNASAHTMDGKITISLDRKDEFVRISVTDTGRGISPENMPNLFSRYHTKQTSPNETGNGLGLYICKYIVEAHSGTISATSEVGHGSCFTFTLPTAR